MYKWKGKLLSSVVSFVGTFKVRLEIVLLRQGLHWQSQTIIARRTFLQKPGLPFLTLALTMPLLNPFHQYDVEVLRPRTSCMSATLRSLQSSSLLPPVDRVTSWTSSLPILQTYINFIFRLCIQSIVWLPKKWGKSENSVMLPCFDIVEDLVWGFLGFFCFIAKSSTTNSNFSFVIEFRVELKQMSLFWWVTFFFFLFKILI